MHRLNILNLATTDEGGAGMASRQLNTLFNTIGHNSILLVKESKSQNRDGVVVINKCPRKNSLKYYLLKLNNQISRFVRWIRTGPADSKYYFFNLNESKIYYSANEILNRISFKPDVIVLHWISNFIGAQTIKELSELSDAKMFWIMMDNAPITGGCHFPWDCTGYYHECQSCPALYFKSKKEIASNNLAFKKKVLPKKVVVITGSKSDYLRARCASVFARNDIVKVFGSVNECIYNPGLKKIVKHFFKIENSKKVIMFGASHIKNIRKGGEYFINALELLQKESKGTILFEDVVVLVIGKGMMKCFKSVKIPLVFADFLSEEDLIKAYQAADIYVSTSIEDSGPLMINQSLMCGTPVVSFNMGVASDLVITGKTGYLAELKNFSDLAKGIGFLINLQEEERLRISNNCRQLAMESYSIAKAALVWNSLIHS